MSDGRISYHTHVSQCGKVRPERMPECVPPSARFLYHNSKLKKGLNVDLRLLHASIPYKV